MSISKARQDSKVRYHILSLVETDFVLKSQIVGIRLRTGHAYITIKFVRHQASTKTFQSCDIDKIMTEHEDRLFRVMMFAGILHHLEILCEGLGISHLTYATDDDTIGIGGFLPHLGFKHCACTDMAGPTKCCIAIPSTKRVGQEVSLNGRAQGAKSVDAKVMNSASDDDDLSTTTCRLDRGVEVQKAQRRRGKKVYCTHWLSKGNCAYMQQGCIYKHEIPRDQETWESLGFHTIPGWLQAKSSAWINQHLRKSRDLSEDLSAQGSSVARKAQPQINALQDPEKGNGSTPPAHGRIQPRQDVSIMNVPFVRKSQPQSNTLQNVSEEKSDRTQAYKRLQPRHDVSGRNVLSLRARPCNERAEPSSTDKTRKRATNGSDDWNQTTRNSKKPRYQEDLFPEEAEKGAIGSSRFHSTGSIDDPVRNARGASWGHWGNSDESVTPTQADRGNFERGLSDSHGENYQPPPHRSTISRRSTSGASRGNDYGEDPVTQASQFLGDWQVETPDIVWGSYPSHGS